MVVKAIMAVVEDAAEALIEAVAVVVVALSTVHTTPMRGVTQRSVAILAVASVDGTDSVLPCATVRLLPP